MSTATTPRAVAPRPIAGARFKAAAKLPVTGTKRRKLVLAIAALQDAGHEPSVRELAERIGVDWRKVDRLLRALEADGHLAIQWAPKRSGARNLYMLRLEPQLPQTMPARAGGEECS